jgi:hypothetical protein
MRLLVVAILTIMSNQTSLRMVFNPKSFCAKNIAQQSRKPSDCITHAATNAVEYDADAYLTTSALKPWRICANGRLARVEDLHSLGVDKCAIVKHSSRSPGHAVTRIEFRNDFGVWHQAVGVEICPSKRGLILSLPTRTRVRTINALVRTRNARTCEYKYHIQKLHPNRRKLSSSTRGTC